MHPRILAQRTGLASEKLVKAARRLAKAIDLPEDLVNALMPPGNNSQIKPMLVLEACANLVEAAANVAERIPMVEIEPIPPLVIETPEGEITVAASLEIETDETAAEPPAPIASDGDAEAEPAPVQTKKNGRTK